MVIRISINYVFKIDKILLNEEWTSCSFIEDNLIITLFAIFRRIRFNDVISFKTFKSNFHIIFYISISFCGSEITYRSKHFIKCNKILFFDLCVKYINLFSKVIYRVNTDNFFFEHEKKKLFETKLITNKL